MLDKFQSNSVRKAEPVLSPIVDFPSALRRRGKRVCIVGVSSISQNPRVLKEADALAAAGYEVVVLFLQHFEWACAMDRRIIERAKWRADIIDVSASLKGRIRRFASVAQLLLFRRLCRWRMGFPVAELAYSGFFLPLLWRAIRHRCDLYIGHYPASLPVAACAAWWTDAKFGFDFEDFHRGETHPAALNGLQAELLATLEDRYLHAADFITAASWGIAEEVAKTTALPSPKTVLNVFPWSERASLSKLKPQPPDTAISLYWFSQIVSLDRGLQDVIGAMALMRERAELHIRGSSLNGSVDDLRRFAEQKGIGGRIHFHSIVIPDELLAGAAAHDVGLCVEVPATLNRDVCITNKIFLYMLAGLAIVASRTRGQSDILSATPEIGSLYDSGNIAALAAILDRYAADRALLARTKAAALAAARDRWNWERESRMVIDVVDQLFVAGGAR